MVNVKPIRKLLVANRGEIARRVLRTCAAMGIRTVAVYSDADRHAPHAREANEAIHIGPAPARDSYLRIEKIIDAAKRTGCDAIHPGYGFLSENPEFAEACAAASITFVGPTPQAMRSMASKTAGRDIAKAAGVPIVPGPEGGFPLLVKAAAGGGGKGMRRVDRAEDLDEAMLAAAREAQAAFGDASLFVEKYVERARHVEVQILGDQHGNIVHLYERECSLQRRHQKLIEESPSPGLNPETRATLTDAALRLAHAIHYTSAGTVEFLLAPDNSFYFIEVNARIQVEHPVTEAITGFDLIRLQIEIAEGRPIPFAQDEIQPRGHAIEARLCAEDPDNDFLPSTGSIRNWIAPSGVRVDAGIETGTEIGIHYDSMLAKIIAHAPDRPAAIRQLRLALHNLIAQGPITNRLHLLHLLEHPDFESGATHTAFVQAAGPAPPVDATQAIAILSAHLDRQNPKRNLTGVPRHYRNNFFRDPFMKFEADGKRHTAAYHLENGVYTVTIDGAQHTISFLSDTRIEIDGQQITVHIATDGDLHFVDTASYSHRLKRVSRYPQSGSGPSSETANSPMPGQVLRILVEPGKEVKPGDPLLVLEAMKMEQTIRASIHGRVGQVLVRIGQVVSPGQMLVEIGAFSETEPKEK